MSKREWPESTQVGSLILYASMIDLRDQFMRDWVETFPEEPVVCRSGYEHINKNNLEISLVDLSQMPSAEIGLIYIKFIAVDISEMVVYAEGKAIDMASDIAFKMEVAFKYPQEVSIQPLTRLVEKKIFMPIKPLPPEPPRKCEPGANLDDWFAWMEAGVAAGYKITLKGISLMSGYSYGYVKQLHANYVRNNKTESEYENP